jgi:hypothetical protein
MVRMIRHLTRFILRSSSYRKRRIRALKLLLRGTGYACLPRVGRDG